MFADIAGFTAWSSEREPSQVFKLLESLYRKFDELANKLGVFKVETIGDCYVAVTGLPDPVPDHAVLCARFSFEILFHMRELTKQFEGTLGPGTSDLALRIGLHSGAVTAGVLRGEKSRFQLFGDTMNTAARIESCGFPDRVQCSEYSARLIKASGKEHWLTQRYDLVVAKGKGEMQVCTLK
jgi:class 3 adenylate cyclase